MKSKPKEWPIRIALCSGCGEVVPNDDMEIVEGTHRRRWYSSSGEMVVDDLCGEVAIYEYLRTLTPNGKVTKPRKGATAPVGRPFGDA